MFAPSPPFAALCTSWLTQTMLGRTGFPISQFRPVASLDRQLSTQKHIYFHLFRSQVLPEYWSDPGVAQGRFFMRAREGLDSDPLNKVILHLYNCVATAMVDTTTSTTTTTTTDSSDHAASLLDLPRECVALILSFLSPRDLCTLSSVCRSLRLVADSDDAWQHRLPHCTTPPVASLDRQLSTKKHIYFHLLRSQVLPEYWTHPGVTQGRFFMRARNLYIAWGGDTRYWEWQQTPESWFDEAAHLLSVCWLEVRGNIQNTIFLPGVYVVSFRIMLVNPDGFRDWPIKLRVSTSNGQLVESERFLEGDQSRCRNTVAPLRPVGGDWFELDVGEFSVETEMSLTVDFSLRETEGQWWKQGLVLDCVKVQLSNALFGI